MASRPDWAARRLKCMWGRLFEMMEKIEQVVPSDIRSNWLIALVVGLSGLALPTTGWSQQDVVQTSTKSEIDEKPSIDESHPLYKILLVAYKAKKELSEVDDYHCIFLKKEVLKNNKLVKSKMEMKFREKPFSVYLKFDPKDPNANREVLFVQGQNGNNLLVHEGGLASALGTFTIAPLSKDALAENKYPITNIGMRKLLDQLIKQFEAEGKFDGIKTQVRKDSRLPSGEKCSVYEAIHERFNQFKFHISRLYIDDDTGLAIGVQQFGFPDKNAKEPPLVEEYFYTQLKTNVKLTDADFDPKNPKYAFK
jgi:hypothetical protein